MKITEDYVFIKQYLLFYNINLFIIIYYIIYIIEITTWLCSIEFKLKWYPYYVICCMRIPFIVDGIFVSDPYLAVASCKYKNLVFVRKKKWASHLIEYAFRFWYWTRSGAHQINLMYFIIHTILYWESLITKL